jgi:hypothetical protein
MSKIRIAALGISIAIGTLLAVMFDAEWYVWGPAGALGYLITRYIGYVIEERRRIWREIDQMAKSASLLSTSRTST